MTFDRTLGAAETAKNGSNFVHNLQENRRLSERYTKKQQQLQGERNSVPLVAKKEGGKGGHVVKGKKKHSQRNTQREKKTFSGARGEEKAHRYGKQRTLHLTAELLKQVTKKTPQTHIQILGGVVRNIEKAQEKNNNIPTRCGFADERMGKDHSGVVTTGEGRKVVVK